MGYFPMTHTCELPTGSFVRSINEGTVLLATRFYSMTGDEEGMGAMCRIHNRARRCRHGKETRGQTRPGQAQAQSLSLRMCD